MRHAAWIVTAAMVLAASSWALDDAAVRKKIAELGDKDAAVRAAALVELTPLYAELQSGMMTVFQDRDPKVVAAMAEFQRQLRARMEQAIQAHPELARSRQAANETAAVAACKFFCESEEIYHRTDYDADGVLEYAQSLKGDNSLVEKKAGANDLALVDKSFADAEGEPGKAKPKAGYCFKVLKQGAAATGGARDYVIKDHMTLGYALIAYPAEYGKTGKHCFIVNNSGTIFQRDLGPETHAIVEKMTEFNPDKGWEPAE